MAPKDLSVTNFFTYEHHFTDFPISPFFSSIFFSIYASERQNARTRPSTMILADVSQPYHNRSRVRLLRIPNLLQCLIRGSSPNSGIKPPKLHDKSFRSISPQFRKWQCFLLRSSFSVTHRTTLWSFSGVRAVEQLRTL